MAIATGAKGDAVAAEAAPAGVDVDREEPAAPRVYYPIATSQYNSATLYQVFYRIQSLLF
jgi:hypothetical protein